MNRTNSGYTVADRAFDFPLLPGRNAPTADKSGPLTVEKVELYASENASNHRTDKYEQVTEHKNPVLRRAAPFYLAVQGRSTNKDIIEAKQGGSTTWHVARLSRAYFLSYLVIL